MHYQKGDYMKRAYTLSLVSILLLGSCQESMEDRCAREVKEYNDKRCPARINEYTDIDSVVFDRSTLTTHYYYTIKGEADNPEAIKRINPRTSLLEGLRNSTSTLAYKEAGYNFAYTYHSHSTGKILFDIVFTSNDYK